MSSRRALLPLIAVFAAAFSVPAKSASPEGLWLVEDQAGRIRIEKCGNEMWGFLAWQKEARNDTNNPNPALRNKSMVGVPILLGMKPVGDDRWEGNVYNPRDGKTYSSKIAMLPSGKLEIKGCVMGILCSGENWSRLAQDPPGTAPKTNCAGVRR
jgi:uncharacterized protein (DUF2147 family)